MNVRENARELTKTNKDRFVKAILDLKNEGNPRSGRNYDTYVRWHNDSIFPETNEFGFWSYSHGCPGFLPWHRKFLQLIEKDLQDISGDSNLTIPYWDWTTDGADSPIWNEDFLGGNGVESEDWKVMIGPFAHSFGNWNLNVRNSAVEPDAALRRAFGVGEVPLPTLEGDRGVKAVYDITPYDSDPWTGAVDFDQGFRNSLERPIHGPPHPWVGGLRPAPDGRIGIGSMSNVFTSPNDPVFFLHHANVDRIWAKWQDLHPELSYLPLTPLEGVRGSGKDELMPPFGEPVRSVLDYRALGYEYDGRASDDAPAVTSDARREAVRDLEFNFV